MFSLLFVNSTIYEMGLQEKFWKCLLNIYTKRCIHSMSNSSK